MKPAAAKPHPKIAPTVFVATLLILLTVIRGGVGLAVSIFGGTVLESHVDSTRPAGPVLSYGQQVGMMIVPLCTLIGAAIGFSIAVAFFRYPRLAIILLLTTFFVGWGIRSTTWNSQIANNGPDPSEVVLSYPPMSMCMLAVCVSGVILLWGIVKNHIATRATGRNKTNKALTFGSAPIVATRSQSLICFRCC